jgi:hypothetical protein
MGMRRIHLRFHLWLITILTVPAGYLVFAASCSAAQSDNPPQIEYLQVLNSNDKPHTSFHRGDVVRFRLEVYSVSSNLHGVSVHWLTQEGRHTIRQWSNPGGFTGPTRGNLFRAIQSMHLAEHAALGTYTVSASLNVQGRHLTRSVRFYLRRSAAR